MQTREASRKQGLVARGKLSREGFLWDRDEQETEIKWDDGQTYTETGREVPEDAAWHGAAIYPGPDANLVRSALCVGGEA